MWALIFPDAVFEEKEKVADRNKIAMDNKSKFLVQLVLF